jgi:hypothetical protein
MCEANPLWGASRIHGELMKLGVNVSEALISKYMIRSREPPSQGWRTFLENQAKDIIATDFFTVPTATFQVLFVLVVLSHDWREILHINVTESPTGEWTTRQIIEDVGLDEVPKYLVRDRDRKFCAFFSRHIETTGPSEVVTAPALPWQNAYAERVIGSIRRACLDHIITVGGQHLRRTVKRYDDYCNRVSTHLSLEKDAPKPRLVQFPCGGAIRPGRAAVLHHENFRQAA